jgi:glycosyltransferase involved in cell wall biosynthesis
MTKHQGNDKYVVILSTSYWDAPLKFRRHQWALLASENGYKTIFVNPTFTIASFVQDKDAKHIFWDYFRKPLQPNKNLVVLTMPPLLPLQRKFLWIDKLNRKICKLILKRKLKSVKSGKDVTILVYEPNDIYRLINIPNSILVYECVDEHSEYPYNRNVKEKVIAVEKQLLRKADLVSVTSLFLLEKKKVFNANNIYAPNGVNFELFYSAVKADTPVAKDIDVIKEPIILYVGAIMEWFDYELLLSISDNKNWNVVLIGPQTMNSHLFKGRSNIHSLGVRRQSELPKYLKKAAVCIIPFLINDLVKGVNPLKLYEYLAAGKPVVSTALPDVIPFEKRNFVHIGNSREEFIAQLDYLINVKDNEDMIQSRAMLAKEYSWKDIYQKLFHRIETIRIQKTSSGAAKE